MRLRALPLGVAASAFIEAHETIIVVELNHDGQMCQLLRLHCLAQATQIRSLAHSDGLPLTAEFVAKAIANTCNEVQL